MNSTVASHLYGWVQKFMWKIQSCISAHIKNSSCDFIKNYVHTT